MKNESQGSSLIRHSSYFINISSPPPPTENKNNNNKGNGGDVLHCYTYLQHMHMQTTHTHTQHINYVKLESAIMFLFVSVTPPLLPNAAECGSSNRIWLESWTTKRVLCHFYQMSERNVCIPPFIHPNTYCMNIIKHLGYFIFLLSISYNSSIVFVFQSVWSCACASHTEDMPTIHKQISLPHIDTRRVISTACIHWQTNSIFKSSRNIFCACVVAGVFEGKVFPSPSKLSMSWFVVRVRARMCVCVCCSVYLKTLSISTFGDFFLPSPSFFFFSASPCCVQRYFAIDCWITNIGDELKYLWCFKHSVSLCYCVYYYYYLQTEYSM